MLFQGSIPALISGRWLTGRGLFPPRPPSNHPVLLPLDDLSPCSHYTPYLSALLMRFIFLIMSLLTCRRSSILSYQWPGSPVFQTFLLSGHTHTHTSTLRQSSWSLTGQACFCVLTYKPLCSGSIDKRKPVHAPAQLYILFVSLLLCCVPFCLSSRPHFFAWKRFNEAFSLGQQSSRSTTLVRHFNAPAAEGVTRIQPVSDVRVLLNSTAASVVTPKKVFIDNPVNSCVPFLMITTMCTTAQCIIAFQKARKYWKNGCQEPSRVCMVSKRQLGSSATAAGLHLNPPPLPSSPPSQPSLDQVCRGSTWAYRLPGA